MSEREELITAVHGAIMRHFQHSAATEKAAVAAADAILSRRPADDEGLVEMAEKAAEARFATLGSLTVEDASREAMRAALSVFRAHDPLLREARGALVKAQWALQPFSDRVFNDNGDCTVNTEPVSADKFTDAHFAYRAVRAVLRKLGAP